ncbi:type IV pilus biogenesis protein PilM [Pseudomonas sp. NyZ201]|uniref:type IV pilus biogenesis protein PilM n=1 Tax=Pseudomonas sp. NyZ201 TaxID=3409857 RepID=UPI003CF2D9B5
MSLQWIVLTFLLLAVGVIDHYQDQSAREADSATIDAVCRGLLVYRSAAAEFAKDNPSFTGYPDEDDLNLPGWYSKPTGVAAFIAAGQSFTYYTGHAAAGLPAELVRATRSASVGVNRSGILVSPSTGQTDISIPASVPEGAVVAVN